jgi:hypothetical protein
VCDSSDNRQGFATILSLRTCGFDAGEAIPPSAWLSGRLLRPWPKLQGFAMTCDYGVHESIEKPWITAGTRRSMYFYWTLCGIILIEKVNILPVLDTEYLSRPSASLSGQPVFFRMILFRLASVQTGGSYLTHRSWSLVVGSNASPTMNYLDLTNQEKKWIASIS